ncbi:hypothetical protein JCGZ_20246 [Jatropha curcas]|uniref:VQ domain-containing protein n=1 Tax=Jatropha curcas TaxID=180498 RepID=A0A067JX91_JATCU|nr:VQ motif-containing protein 22 [Jatropha curcas]KDP27418.1 hypothetical protein JCGZ_20246 [Jatropha curcas]
MPTSSDWLQFYDQTTIYGHTSLSSSFGFSDSTIATSTTSSSSPNHQSIPNKGLISKPIRRRSRTSKKTPTTLLNANTSNFRALVQQFTGCHSKTSSFSSRKGPINLNFQMGSVQNGSAIGTTGIAPFSNTYNTTSYDYDQQAEKQYLHHQQVVQQQEQKYMVSSSILDDLFFPSGSCEKETTTTTAINNMEIPACELLIDDFSLHELARQSLSRENLDDVYF